MKSFFTKYSFFILLLFLLFLRLLLRPIYFNKPYSYVLYADNGHLLDIHVASDGQWRFKLQSDSIPIRLAKATMFYEDKCFLFHNGVDFYALIRALYLNLKHSKIVSGGSTITMQIARMYFGNEPRTIFQKLKEILLAWYMEFTMSKSDIILQYLENAPYGGNIVGIEAASWKYFQRPAYTLSWAESAMIAVIPNDPTNINLKKNKEALKIKRDKLLQQLYNSNIIDEQTYKISIEEPIPEVQFSFPHKAPHLLQWLIKKYPDKYIFHSTLNENLQTEVYSILERYRKNMVSNNIRNAAVMVCNVHNGNVIAYIGNFHDKVSESDANYVNVIESPRSGGSILKPLLYATMIDNGELLPDMLIPDVPVQIGNYAPKNFNRGYDGAVRAHMALARSLNVPAVKMLQAYGIQRFIDFLKKLQFTTITKSQDYYGLSLILGGCEIKMSDLMNSYTQVAWKLKNKTQSEYKFSYLQDKPEKTSTSIPLSNCAIWLTFNAMVDVERPANEQYWYLFKTKQKIAWKTGTSFGFRDAWAVGISSDYSVGVWVGNATGEGSAELTGIKKAAPILFDIFSVLPHTSSWFETPYDDLQVIEVCKQSGYPASYNCNEKVKSVTCKRPIKVKLCPYHKQFMLDSSQKFRVNSDCESVSKMVKKTFFVLPPTMEYYYKKKNPWYKPLPPYRSDCIGDEAEQKQNIEVVYPQQFTNVFIPRNLDGSPSSVMFEVTHRYPNTTIYWYLDGKFIGQTNTKHILPLNTSIGKHFLTVQDEFGESQHIEFNVLNSQPND